MRHFLVIGSCSLNQIECFIHRDAGVVAIGHFVWSIMGVLMVFSLIGVTLNKQIIDINTIKNMTTFTFHKRIVIDSEAIGATGKGFWLIGITLAESAMQSMDFNWLWSGLLFCLMVLTTAATIMGCMETLSSCIIDEWPSMKSYKPAITFTFLAFVFMINLVMATKGGIYIYYLLTSYYTTWPLLFLQCFVRLENLIHC